MRSVKRKRWEPYVEFLDALLTRVTVCQNGEPKSSEPPFFGNNPMQGQLVRRLPALSCPQDEPGGSGVTAGSHLPMYDNNCR